MVADIFTQPPYHKKASYDPVNTCMVKLMYNDSTKQR